ncbi:uncharacterized protein LOC120536670 isoform X2 [Polypterus senegalus]|uniref:uncharacterized protein LOC120536670 isoform X2 n=1 Tax=Polypterus senegalus TaxID=55291 RepID=UPI001962DEE2|nr:uncharacterized protein LOC120536670 isoform X2 [Polypterus senegalus]
MSISVKLSFFFFLLYSGTSAKFDFSTPQSVVTTHVHNKVFLPCYFTVAKKENNLTFVIVTWKHRNVKLAEYKEGEVKTTINRAELLKSELHEGNASLILTDVTMADEGVYECEVAEAPSEGKGKIQLNVIVPPKVFLKHRLLLINQTSTLECRAEDFYPSNISIVWMRGSNPLPAQKPPQIYNHPNGTFSAVSEYTYTPTSEDIDVPFYCQVKFALEELMNETFKVCNPVFEWSPRTPHGNTGMNVTCKLYGCQFSKVRISVNKDGKHMGEKYCMDVEECVTKVEILPSTAKVKEVNFSCEAKVDDFQTIVINFTPVFQDEPSCWNEIVWICLSLLLLACAICLGICIKRKCGRQILKVTELLRCKDNSTVTGIHSEDHTHLSSPLKKEDRKVEQSVSFTRCSSGENAIQDEICELINIQEVDSEQFVPSEEHGYMTV